MQESVTTKEMFFLIRELVKMLRLFQNDKAICEEVTFTQFCIMDCIAEKGELPLSELHDFLAVEKSTTTRLVEPLVEKMLVARCRCEHDCRAVTLSLTPEGKKTHHKVGECMDTFSRNILDRIPAKQRKDVMAGVTAFIDSFYRCCK